MVRVLVVDDEPMNQKIVATVTRRAAGLLSCHGHTDIFPYCYSRSCIAAAGGDVPKFRTEAAFLCCCALLCCSCLAAGRMTGDALITETAALITEI